MSAQHWLKQIRNLTSTKTIRIMNVCGGHERTLSESGIRSLLPQHIKLIPGPGCPVCVCPEESIQFAIKLSEQSHIILASFGDMLRVPGSNGKKTINSLLESRSNGNQVVAIASPMEVIKLAERHPDKAIVFFVAGFETTLAPVVAMLEQGIPDNVKLLLAARKTWPIVEYLLNSQNHQLDALIAPGHVASVMGSQEWDFISEQFKLPCAIAGFNESSMLSAIYSVCRQTEEGRIFLDNCYSSVVAEQGNAIAKDLIDKYFTVYDALWRGIGIVGKSGFTFRATYNNLNAEVFYEDLWIETLNQSKLQKSDMPRGCDCDQVVLGKIFPDECRLYGKVCTPSKPIGPCMVSDEGACHIWWSTGSVKAGVITAQ